MNGIVREHGLVRDHLLLGVDGGGTRCRARLCSPAGGILGEAEAGPANIRLGLDQAFAQVAEAAARCLALADLPRDDQTRIVACLALAGASEPTSLTAAQAKSHPFRKALIITDAHAACLGAHAGGDGGVVIVGTGTVGWAVLNGRSYRVGGWGLPISDEGSGAWLGCEALRRTLWAHDGRFAWSALLREIFSEFGNDPHRIVRWTATASPGGFAAFAARIVHHAAEADQHAIDLLETAARHVDALAEGLMTIGAERIALVGGLAQFVESRLSKKTKSHLVVPAGDALQGALSLALRSVEPAPQPDSIQSARRR
jgi:glucosamine kinase